MKLIFATGNRGKLREASDILGPEYELVTPADLGIFEEIPETSDTLRANSIQKAEYLYTKTGMDCFADDTGLEVDALGGAPGVHSARYAGEGHDFNANIDKLLAAMEGIPDGQRTARFKNVVTLILDGKKYFFEGVVEGKIATHRKGDQGFGYDPIFEVDVFGGKTFAEVGEEAKNLISHRGQTLRAMSAWLKDRK